MVIKKLVEKDKQEKSKIKKQINEKELSSIKTKGKSCSLDTLPLILS